MCGRYFVDRAESAEDLDRIIDALNRRGQIVKTGEVFPGDPVAVIANSRGMSPAPFAMTWGYRGPGQRLIINARSESAADKPLFRDGMHRRRCALPALAYYEWQQTPGGKVKYAIRPRGEAPFYLAGIYTLADGQPRCTVLTRSPADSIAFIHDRMPVLLPRDALQDWLDPRFAAADVLRAALTDMRCAPAAGLQQLSLLS